MKLIIEIVSGDVPVAGIIYGVFIMIFMWQFKREDVRYLDDEVNKAWVLEDRP